MTSFHFLLIDDNNLDLFITERFLTISGLASTIQSFNSAEDGLQYISQQGENLPYSVLLLDLQMPGMNGFDFVKAFSDFQEDWQKKIDIYILSSTVDRGDIEKVKKNPYIRNIISKPLNVDHLKALIDTDAGVHQ